MKSARISPCERMTIVVVVVVVFLQVELKRAFLFLFSIKPKGLNDIYQTAAAS